MKTKYISVKVIILKIMFFVFLIVPICVFSQNYTLVGDRSFGTIGGEGDAIVFSYQGRILIAGYSSYTGINGDKTEASCSTLPIESDVWMLFVDENFNIIWDKTLGGLGRDEIHDISLGLNNSIVLTGETLSDSSCEISTDTRGVTDIWLIMVDSNGNKLHDARYGSSLSDFGGKLIRDQNSDFLIFGSSLGGISGDKTTAGYGGYDFWLIRTDSVGSKLWDKTYGGSGSELAFSRTDYALSNIRNSEFVICGRTNSNQSGTISTNGFGFFDIWVAKIDQVGLVQWDKRLGGNYHEYVRKIVDVQDGYILIGSSTSKFGGTISDTGIAQTDVWIVKIDTLGNQLWEKRLGGINDDYGVDIQESPDGGYWILANTNSPAGYDISENSYGGSDYWIFKIDSIGNKIWDKRFGGPGNDFASSFIVMPDSSIFIGGDAASGISPVKTDSGKGGRDYWIVHFNYYNNTTGIHSTNAANGITVSPNPTKDIINFKGLPLGQYEAILFGVDGRLIKRSLLQGGNEVSYSLNDVSPGMYLLRFNGDKFIATVKVLKE